MKTVFDDRKPRSRKTATLSRDISQTLTWSQSIFLNFFSGRAATAVAVVGLFNILFSQSDKKSGAISYATTGFSGFPSAWRASTTFRTRGLSTGSTLNARHLLWNSTAILTGLTDSTYFSSVLRINLCFQLARKKLNKLPVS